MYVLGHSQVIRRHRNTAQFHCDVWTGVQTSGWIYFVLIHSKMLRCSLDRMIAQAHCYTARSKTRELSARQRSRTDPIRRMGPLKSCLLLFSGNKNGMASGGFSMFSCNVVLTCQLLAVSTSCCIHSGVFNS